MMRGGAGDSMSRRSDVAGGPSPSADGWWSTDDLEGLSARIASLRLEQIAEWLPRGLALNAGAVIANAQTRRGATRVAREHYDFDQSIFAAFLGETMNYSCAYFQGTD